MDGNMRVDGNMRESPLSPCSQQVRGTRPGANPSPTLESKGAPAHHLVPNRDAPPPTNYGTAHAKPGTGEERGLIAASIDSRSASVVELEMPETQAAYSRDQVVPSGDPQVGGPKRKPQWAGRIRGRPGEGALARAGGNGSKQGAQNGCLVLKHGAFPPRGPAQSEGAMQRDMPVSRRNTSAPSTVCTSPSYRTKNRQGYSRERRLD